MANKLTPKYKTEGELASARDGLVTLLGSKLSNNDFKTEKELSDYIKLNADRFCKDHLNDTLVSIGAEVEMSPRFTFGPRRRRVDLLIKCEKKQYLVELKKPKYANENRKGIGQLLDYGREFTDSEKELILITTLFDINTAETIFHYGLPIRYLYMNKAQVFEYKGVA